MSSKVEMFKYSASGIRYWSIEPDYDIGMLYIEFGTYNGAIQLDEEAVEINESGRSLEEQVDLRMNRRITKKRDIGYRETIEESKSVQGMNTIGLPRPMLAHRFDKVKDIDFNKSYVQMKYDGHRCLITRQGTDIVAYSRNGRRINTIGHITSNMHIPTGVILDGELYCHGESLQTITSWAKRKQPSTEKLQYIVYDIVSKDPYNERYNRLKSMALGPNTVVIPTDKHIDPDHIPLLLKTAVESGYEGLILRQCNYPYESGKRSKGLIKIKHFMDDEFVVVGIHASKDGWAILTCETKNGATFQASAPGNIGQRIIALQRKSELIGRKVTIRYASITKDGIPFHPIAERWRDDL